MELADVIKEYRAAKDDYLFRGDIFDDDPEKVRIIKRIITEKLSQPDRAILLLYCECESYRVLGKALGVSHVTAGRELKRIRAKVLEEYKKATEKK